ncbi:MAG: hypothetical protein ACRD3V_04550 [Vicinamibacteria bacterium]
MKYPQSRRSIIVLGALALCLLASAAGARPGEDAVTFTRDVAPILQQKCEACHREGSMAPMSLVSYEETRPWAMSIKDEIAARRMPPWHIDKTVGIQSFANDRSLSDEQIATIVRWVDEGAPKGNPSDMPPPLEWPDEQIWTFAERFGEPDLILTSPPYTVPVQAQDAWFKPVTETGLTEARWVRAIEIRPTAIEGRRVTHHALARLEQEEPEESDEERTNAPEDEEAVGPGLFMEWAVGKQGEIMRENSGKLMLPGSKIVWDLHYHAVGEEITTAAELAIYFYPKGEEPKFRQVLGLFHAIGGGPGGLDIPPNTVSVHQGFHVMKQAGRIENYQPHMHLRGKAMSMEAILPNGKTEILNHVDNFQFNWHNNYVYTADAAPLLPKGTVLRFTSWHDNTTANKSNPDPAQWVGWGDRTVDEMAHAWVNITYMEDEDYRAEVEKRKATEGQPTTEPQNR